MNLFQFSMRLSQNEVQAQERQSGIRIVQLQGEDCYYYSQKNFLAKLDFFEVLIYNINANTVELNKELTNSLPQGPFQKVFFLENHIVFYKVNQKSIQFNIENYDQSQIIFGPLPQPQLMIKYGQINRKSLLIIRDDKRLRIYTIRNFKKSHTLLNKVRITSTQYHKHIVQAFTWRHLYYYNTKMTKQIRKYCNYQYQEPIFNSNYLFLPMFSQKKSVIHKRLINLTIYDIQSMNRKGTLVITNINQQIYDSCIFIKDFNVIGVLYKTRLDLYDFATLKYIGREEFENYHQLRKLLMKYDRQNGLTIFQ